MMPAVLLKIPQPVGGKSIKKKKEYMVKRLTRKDFQKWGRKGGLQTKKKGKDFYSELGKKGSSVKWKKNEK